MFRFILVFSLFFSFTGWVHAQVGCSSSYIPKPFQDCPGAIRLCGAVYEAETATLCGSGAIPNEARGRCGTFERTSSWYTFQVSTPGLLAFIIQPNDVTGPSLTDYANVTGRGATDYDFAVFKLPAGSSHNVQTCRLLAPTPGIHTPNPYDVACNFSGQKGVTGLYDQRGARNSVAFGAPIQAEVGDVFVLLVDNFTSTTVGYKIQFFTPADSSIYADVTQTTPFGISNISYDPACQGNCPVTIRFTQPIRCTNLAAQIFSASNIGTNLINDIVCLGGAAGFSDSILVYGDFNPTDTTLQLMVGNADTTDATYLYQCSANVIQADTVLLKPMKGYNTVTALGDRFTPYFTVAPNPFTHQLTSTLPTAGKYVVTVYDATGRLVYKEDNLSGTVTINLPPTLAPGLYLVDMAGGGVHHQQRLQRQ